MKANDPVAGIIGLILCCIFASMGIVYLCNGWTPLCERLAEVGFVLAVASLFYPGK